MNTEHDWLVWWHDEGSGMRPVNGQDHESHVRDMTRIAWLNGAFGAADEIERLRRRLLAYENAYDIERRQNEHLQTDRNNLALEVERLRAERDEARREVCDFCESGDEWNAPEVAREIAEERGWDCFKEDTDD